MKAWAAALAGEVATWPQVHSRAFFGFTAIYREDRLFALLPRTHALEPSNSIAFQIGGRRATYPGASAQSFSGRPHRDAEIPLAYFRSECGG